jgi:hypothetical protein
VILAFATLGISIAVLGELIRIGTRNAEYARDMTQAQLLCESKLNEILSGIELPANVLERPLDVGMGTRDTDWTYSVAVQTTSLVGVLSVTVTVSKKMPENERPLATSLVRWVRDPDLVFTDESTTESETETGSGSTSTGSTTTSVHPPTGREYA